MAPASRARSTRSRWLNAVKMTTGASRWQPMRWAAAIPSRRGIFTSRTTRSGRMLLRELHRPLPVAGLRDDVVPLLGEHLGEVEPDQGLVLGDEDAGC